MKSNYYGVPTQGPDGNILMEFVAMERIWSESSGQDSYDPYTCAVRSAPFLECLDIAGARTLGASLSDSVAYNTTGTSGDLNSNFYSILALGGLLNMTNNTNGTNLFGADVNCDGKVVGDGAVNAYDMATVMWYQFKSKPYDTLDSDPSVVATVEGRDDTSYRCDLGETRRMWNLAIGDDYCHHGQNKEMLGYDTGRRMAQVPVPTINLLAAYGSGHARPQGEPARSSPASLESLNARETRPAAGRRSTVLQEDMLRQVSAMWSLDVDVVEWAQVSGLGRWIRMRSPGVQVVMELYLSGISVDAPVHLSLQRAPAMNCSHCQPVDDDPSNVVVAFARRSEYEAEYASAIQVYPPHNEAELCARIVPATLQTNVMIGNTIALRQQPPDKACAFDVFLWVPESPATGVHVSKHSTPYSFSARRLAAVGAESPLATATNGCNNDIGVLAGSSALDGYRGKVQRLTSCVTYGVTQPLTSPPPPPTPPPSCPTICNTHAPASAYLTSQSFQSRSVLTFVQLIYSSSLRLMQAIASRARGRAPYGLHDYVQFELMLARESQPNNCCPGSVCIAESGSNETEGTCTIPDSPSIPPSSPPNSPPPPPPPKSPPSSSPAVVLTTALTSLVLVGFLGIGCFCCWPVRLLPPNRECDTRDERQQLVVHEQRVVENRVMLFRQSDLNKLPANLLKV